MWLGALPFAFVVYLPTYAAGAPSAVKQWVILLAIAVWFILIGHAR